MSKLCLAACHVVVEVVVAKLDNWCRRTNPILPVHTKIVLPKARSNKPTRPSLAGRFFSYVSPVVSSIIGLGMMSPI